MSELRRWEQDGASDAIARMLQAARGERPSDASLARSIAAASVGAVTATTTVAAGETLGKVGTSSALATKALGLFSGFHALKWLLVGALLGSVVMATVEAPRHPAPSKMAAQKREPIQPRVVAPASAKAPDAAMRAPDAAMRASDASPATPSARSLPSEAPPSPEPVPATSERTLPPGSARTADAARRTPALVESERLAEEVRIIDEATRALNGGAATRALTLLDAYDRSYPERRFAPEALYLRMESLTKLGRGGEARSIANRLANAYPTSPQAARARVLLTDTIR